MYTATMVALRALEDFLAETEHRTFKQVFLPFVSALHSHDWQHEVAFSCYLGLCLGRFGRPWNSGSPGRKPWKEGLEGSLEAGGSW